MIFNELRKHGRLAAKRHPMYEKNKVAKILGYVMGAFWAGYLIFFGTTFAFGFSDMVPNREPYHVMNGVVLIFILALDFLLRVPFQKTPSCCRLNGIASSTFFLSVPDLVCSTCSGYSYLSLFLSSPLPNSLVPLESLPIS